MIVLLALFFPICGWSQELRFGEGGAGGGDSFYVSPHQQVLSEEELQKQENLSTADAISRVYSIQTTGHILGGVTPAIFLRGANSEFTQILWNGLSLNDSTSVGGGADYLSVNREFSSQIRILRGPETLYYGPESLSGLILLDRGEFRDRKMKFTLAEYETAILEIEKRKDLQESRLLFGGSALSSAGISNVKDKSNLYDRDAKAQQSVSAIYEAEKNDQSLQVLVNYFNQRVDDDLSRQEDINAFAKTRDLQGLVQWKTPLKILNPAWSQQFETSFIDKSRTLINSADENSTSTYDSHYEGTKWKLKEALLFEKSGNKTWLGVEYIREQMKSSESYNSSAPDVFQESQSHLNTFVITSIAGPAQSRLDLGLRADQGQSTAWQMQIQKQAVYFLIATGYKTPSIYQRFSSFGNRDLKTQKSVLYEVGEEWSITPEIGTRAALYRTDYTNLIGFTTRYENINQSRSHGAEAELSWKRLPTEVKISIQYNESYQKNPTQILLRRPRWITRADLTEALSDHLQTGVEGEWQSQRLDQDSLGIEQSLAPFSLFHGKISYAWTTHSGQQQERLSLRVNNLLDATYQQAYAYSTPGRFLSLTYSLSN